MTKLTKNITKEVFINEFGFVNVHENVYNHKTLPDYVMFNFHAPASDFDIMCRIMQTCMKYGRIVKLMR